MDEEYENPVAQVREDTAWGYLASEQLGRLAVIDQDGKPDVFPINYAVDGESIVFRSAEGSKLDDLAINNHVCFEVDGWDEETGWSVIVSGRAEVVTDETELRLLAALPLLPWVPTIKKNYVRITPDTEISGRTFRFGDEPETED